MTTVKIVNETGSIMYLNNEGSLVNYYFINNMQFERVTPDQKETLTYLLNKENMQPIELVLTENNVLKLVCKNKNYINNDSLFVFSIFENGEKNGKHIKPNDYKENTLDTVLVDFTERIAIKVEFENNDSLSTSFNGTFSEAEKYYLNNLFNIGTVNDDMQKAINVSLI